MIGSKIVIYNNIKILRHTLKTMITSAIFIVLFNDILNFTTKKTNKNSWLPTNESGTYFNNWNLLVGGEVL